MIVIFNNITPTPSKEGERRVPIGSQLCLKQVLGHEVIVNTHLQFASKQTSTNGG